MKKRRNSAYAKCFYEQIQYAVARFESLGGSVMMGGVETIEKEISRVRYIREKIQNDLPNIELFEKHRIIDDVTRRVRGCAIDNINIRKKQAGLIKGFFMSSEIPDHVRSILDKLERKRPDRKLSLGDSLAIDREYSRNVSTRMIKDADNKLHLYEKLLADSLISAGERERQREIDKENRIARKREIESRKKENEERTRAMAAAHEGETRRLAQSIKREIDRQRSLFNMCPYCGGELGDSPHADHIYPVSKGGLSTARNMVYVCSKCNSMKADLTLAAFIRAFSLDREAIESHLMAVGKDF